MAFQFLYRTNKMNTDILVDYLFNLFNKGKNENQKISKCNIVDLVDYQLPNTSDNNGSGFIDELWAQIEPADSVEYISQEKTLELAVKDFFSQDFASDLWGVDEEVEIVNDDGSETEKREQINITHFDEWDF